jgi:hypothetical protein
MSESGTAFTRSGGMPRFRAIRRALEHVFEFKSRVSVRIDSLLATEMECGLVRMRIGLHVSKGPQLSRSIWTIVV